MATKVTNVKVKFVDYVGAVAVPAGTVVETVRVVEHADGSEEVVIVLNDRVYPSPTVIASATPIR